LESVAGAQQLVVHCEPVVHRQACEPLVAAAVQTPGQLLASTQVFSGSQQGEPLGHWELSVQFSAQKSLLLESITHV